MASHRYREVDPSLPDVGKSAGGPKEMTLDDAKAIMASTDVLALGLLHGYLRSYAATAGAIMFAPAIAAIALVLGWTGVAIIFFALFGMAAWVVMEARRRARKWESVVSTRIAQLTASPG
ncbi:hypothetical protein [Demequina aurantiaca]|uniref:hypothetical protein n=1 Tax=Demequina aurantiaca TaxID=676200 RepID=UPI000A6D48CC|nr:hypothetical protein [Demequina aurantiaca]